MLQAKCLRLLRHMALPHFGDEQAVRAEAGAHPVDEIGKRDLALPFPFKIALRHAERIMRENIEPQEFETETGIEIVMHGGEPLGKQKRHPARIAQWLRSTCRNAEYPAIHPKEHQFEQPAAETAFFKRLFQPHRQPLGKAENILLLLDRLGKLALGRQKRHRAARRDRLLHVTER